MVVVVKGNIIDGIDMPYKKVLLVKPKGRSGLAHLTDLIPIGFGIYCRFNRKRS
ncbi:MAG: hypothetical protein GYA51_16265 [Candidatus Methanofastidiosa archaeon]|nr:hypothetical protein [Candidatus Methanofastidiosa archaeon]